LEKLTYFGIAEAANNESYWIASRLVVEGANFANFCVRCKSSTLTELWSLRLSNVET